MTRIACRIITVAILLTFHCPGAFAAEQDSLTIGLPAPLSGNWSELGKEVVRGAALAADRINGAGGVLGRRLELVIQDSDESVSAAKLLTAYRFMRGRQIQLFLGPTGTPGGVALAPIAGREDVLMISPGVGIQRAFVSPAVNLFNVQGGWETASRMLAVFARETGHNRVAIVSSQHPFDSRQAHAFETEMVAQHGAITAVAEPPPESESLLSYLLSVLRTGPDAIFITNYNQLGLIARKLRELDYRGQLLAVQIDESRLQTAHGALEGAYFAALSEMSVQFKREYQERYGEAPRYLSDYAYDGVRILAWAIEQRRSFEPRVIGKQLPGLEWNGASGRFRFNSEGEAMRTPLLFRITNGTLNRLRR